MLAQTPAWQDWPVAHWQSASQVALVSASGTHAPSALHVRARGQSHVVSHRRRHEP